jgi:2-keto-4-pentenoate hydratase/2-oxohepta-3-ene-1,7-dioic acid hydratase in catechol pathway
MAETWPATVATYRRGHRIHSPGKRVTQLGATFVIGPGDAIRIPAGAGRVDHEGEAGIVIGRTAYRVPAARASAFILGVTCVNDVTAREIQRREGQYTRPKGFDTFAPVGPCIAIGLDPSYLAVECRVNDQPRQASAQWTSSFRCPSRWRSSRRS